MKISRLLSLIIGAFFLFLGMGASGALSKDDFPTRNITIICGFSPGGSTDIQIRGIIPYVQKYLGKGIIVENRTGASGILAYNGVFSAKPDGYTLMVTSIPAITIAEKYFPDSAKFEVKKYSHIFGFAREELILIGHPEMYKSFEDLLRAGADKKLKVGTSGKGQPTHLGAVMLEFVTKLTFNIIPFEGGGESLASLAGKHIDAVVTITSAAMSLTKSGVIRPFLIIGERRHPGYPDTPSAKDLGYDISMLVPYLTGVVGPPNIPEDRVKVLEAAFAEAVKDPDYVKWAKNINIEITPLPPPAFLKETLRGYPAVEKYMEVLKK